MGSFICFRLVRWACRAGTRDFCSWVCSCRPTIFFLTVHYLNSFVPNAQQAGQAAVLGRLSLSGCLWVSPTCFPRIDNVLMMNLISDKIPDLQVSLCSTDELGLVTGRASTEETRVNSRLFLNWRIRDVTVPQLKNFG
jgi:hypothetical protein